MRTIPAELAERYREQGWWTPDTLGDLLARGLAAAPDSEFRVHSEVRPYTGTYADVEVTARRLAAGLRRRGVGPGDVVAMQLPNWMEAAASFWAAALLGAVGALVGGVALVGVAVLLVGAGALIAYQRTRSTDPGMTTELALFTTFLIGVLAIVSPALAAACASARASCIQCASSAIFITIFSIATKA
mgnify:CR=1 FL=1